MADDIRSKAPQTEATIVDAVVIGAGFGGLYATYQLREQGLKVQAIEAGDGVGGTWYWNRYPGARVDSQSYVYQYWFSDEILEKWNWSERFPSQPEVERYLNFVADECDLRKHYAFSTRMTEARYDEARGRWELRTDSGDVYDTQFLVACAGGLSAPKLPDIPGIEDFQGEFVHTARWPKEGVEVRDKRVGVIGTGATGIQVIQTLAPLAKQLTVFQRTPTYAIPMRNPRYDDTDQARIKAQYPELKKQVLNTFTGFPFDFQDKGWYDLSPEERQQIMEEIWADGSLSFWVGTFMEVFFDPEVSEAFGKFVADKIRERVNDPATAEKLIPTNHGFGSRRLPLETNYFEAYNRDTVSLVDIRENPIERITADGVRTKAGDHPLDMLIFATGFDAGTGALSRIDVHGRGGTLLRDVWERNVRTTMGLQVHGFPNLFTTMAPLAPAAAFCNVPTCLQHQVDWIAQCIRYIREQGRSVIEPTREFEEQWVQHHDELANQTIIINSESWYAKQNGDGSRRVISYLGGVNNYRQACEEIAAKGYEGFAIS